MRPALKLSWNQLQLQSRREICRGAGIYETLAARSADEFEAWLQFVLAESLSLRSKGKLELVFNPDNQ